jgi:cysteinyl-tRNA synthetase
MAETREGFLRAMDDDFNTAAALGHLFDLVRAIHRARDSGTSSDALEGAQSMLRELAGVLGLRLERGEPSHPTQEALVDLLVDIRAELRRQNQWELADRIRARMAELGINLEDTKDGTIWRA